MRYIIFIVAAISLVFAFVFASSLYKGKQAKIISGMAKEKSEIFMREHSQTYGSDDAKVYLIEFMDPACETCSAFSPFVKQIIADNPDRIKLVLRYAPFHDGADYFVKILEAAKKQGKYWETLEVMYATQPAWASHHNPQPQLIWQFLPKAGLDMEKIKEDMNDPALAQLIAQDLADAKTLGVTKTPGFFVNGKPLQVFGQSQLKELIDAEIKANYAP